MFFANTIHLLSDLRMLYTSENGRGHKLRLTGRKKVLLISRTVKVDCNKSRSMELINPHLRIGWTESIAQGLSKHPSADNHQHTLSMLQCAI